LCIDEYPSFLPQDYATVTKINKFFVEVTGNKIGQRANSFRISISSSFDFSAEYSNKNPVS
jgi:hypothetical protein